MSAVLTNPQTLLAQFEAEMHPASSVTVDEASGYADFVTTQGTRYWAKLNSRGIKKGSIRLASN